MERVVWQQADAMKLPFSDADFDLIVCQFGVMFFPDKQASFRESFRVLAVHTESLVRAGMSSEIS